MQEIGATSGQHLASSSFSSNAVITSGEDKYGCEQLANDFKIQKLEKEAMKNWDKFYLRNKDHFFKDRNWSTEDLKLLCSHITLNVSIWVCEV